ncbi:MAG: hypothetical protein M3P48_00225 [Actinomycetota bacterium]|nr:hypothetical protein [Actinomycetota bacterium]
MAGPPALLDLRGNWGTVCGDDMAEPHYTEVGLSPLGRLALASERGELGPVPIGLIDGSLYRGGRVPPLNLAGVLRTLRALLDDPAAADQVLVRLLGAPELPSGGSVRGLPRGLYAGRRTRAQLTSRLVREQDASEARIVITGVPLGVAVDEVALFLDSRARMEQRPDEPSDQANPPLGAALRVRDETSMRAGIRVVVAAPPSADLDEIERWVRDVWPVTVDADLQLPEPVGDLLLSLGRGVPPGPVRARPAGVPCRDPPRRLTVPDDERLAKAPADPSRPRSRRAGSARRTSAR